MIYYVTTWATHSNHRRGTDHYKRLIFAQYFRVHNIHQCKFANSVSHSSAPRRRFNNKKKLRHCTAVIRVTRIILWFVVCTECGAGI